MIHKDPGSDFCVSFPDFPGCVTAGATLDEAVEQAIDALALHLDGLAEDGKALPNPSSFQAVMAEREHRDAVAFLVLVAKQVGADVRVDITLPGELLPKLDRAAAAEQLTRSAFVAHAARRAVPEAA